MNAAFRVPGFLLVASVSLGALAIAPAARAADGTCAHEVFTIDGSAVSVSACGAKAVGKSIAVTETFKSPSGSFTHATAIDLVAGEPVARGIDDVALAPLALSRTLHLTFAYRGSALTIEHALLLPGAVPLK